MPLKHPKAPASSTESLSVPPLFTRESADVPRHQLPRLQKQPEPVHDGSTTAGFHH